MSKEKQIEEMTELICDNYANGKCAADGFVCNRNCEYKDRAERLYNAGYRKQEWISVEERLPERNGRYLTHCIIGNQSLVCVLYYCKIGGFNEETITHWMPLPEAPNMQRKEDEGK